jgi:hypothetical protein
MKIKLQKVFIVCLVTLAVFSPTLMVFSIIWRRHLELINIPESIPENLSFENHQQHQVTDELSTAIRDLFSQPNILIFIQWLLFAVPISLGVMLFLHERYLIHRATTHQKNVDMLERLYQQSINK